MRHDREHITVVRPDAPSTGDVGLSALPADLLEQVRGRVRVLALLLTLAFSFDPFFHFLGWTIGIMVGQVPAEFGANLGFILADTAVAVVSAILWWVARRGHASPSRLHTLALGYLVFVCFMISLTNMWQWFLESGDVIPLTWVPTLIVFFPLIMPSPPRRMLAAAIIAGATSPLALLLLDLGDKVPPRG